MLAGLVRPGHEASDARAYGSSPEGLDSLPLPPCQICSGPLDGPSYIARTCEVFSWPRFSYVTDEQPGRLPSLMRNWATDVHDKLSDGTADESKACLVVNTGMLCYWKRGTSDVEEFTRLRWAVNQLQPFTGAMPTLHVTEHDLPYSLVFPICASCTRLVRNYVSHWNKTHPCNKFFGYDALYESLRQRLLSLASHKDYLRAYLVGETDDRVSYLGKAVIVQATPATKPFNMYEVPEWSKAYPFSQVPSLPRWFMSKLRRKEIVDDRSEKHGNSCTVMNTSSDVQKSRSANYLNRLCSLPVEILRLIAASLDRQTLFALRMAATDLANRLPLDQEFWYRQLTHAEMPLLGFEPLTADAHTHIDSRSGLSGRIDAFGDFIAQFKERRKPKFGPSASNSQATLLAKKDWRQYDWKSFARLMAKVDEFMDGGACEDAPEGFRARRWRWSQLDKIFGELKR